MPYAVTHVLIAIIIADIIRDYFLKKKFSLIYILIAGIAGLLPDIDIPIYWIINSFTNIPDIHRAFTHTIFLPLILFGLAFIFKNKKLFKLDLKLTFLMLSLGTFIHLLLDFTLAGYIVLFYPVSYTIYGLNLVQYLPSIIQETFFPSLDAVLLILWLIHEEVKHKISDFI
ncbi:MAG: metal-dependent hydrolase [Nanoarchaeota archaeon]|nr:metal-dependent hydrolase [Nanoarchaeota archaeon]